MVTSRFDKSTGICDFDDMVKSFKLLELPRKEMNGKMVQLQTKYRPG